MGTCELTGKRTVVKNKVSHSNIKTKGKAFVNVQDKRLFSYALNRMVRLKLAASTIKSIEHNGGFDNFVLKTLDKGLSDRAKAVKNQILRKIRKKSTAAAPNGAKAPVKVQK